MNCIQPIAPAELGPMYRPKFDSTSLIAASTCHGIPYAAPAPFHSASSRPRESCCGWAGGVERIGGRAIEPGALGASALGRADGADWSTANVSARAVAA